MSFTHSSPVARIEQCALNIGWCVSALSMDVASVRYRALLPILALDARQHNSVLFTPTDTVDLDALDVVILVKTFNPKSLELARACKARDIPLLIDLCDNVFVEGYGKDKLLPHFLEIAKLANAMVVTTQPLAQFIQARLPELIIHVIPDGLLTPDLVNRSTQKISDATPSRLNAHPQGLVPVRRAGLTDKVISLKDKTFTRLFQWLLTRGPLIALMTRIKSARRSKRPSRRDDSQPLPCSSGQALPGAMKLLWFGNHGASYARFGMLDLVDIREALETIAQEFAVELIVVSSNQGKYAQHIAPMAIPSRYLPWSNEVVEQCLAEASVVLIPNSLDPFSLAKSANRSVHALARGVPVVATRTPALLALAGSIEMDGFLPGLRRYLSDPQAGASDVAKAQGLIDQHCGEAIIGSLWNDVLQGMKALPLQSTLAIPIAAVPVPG